jgi:hypothetical protein
VGTLLLADMAGAGIVCQCWMKQLEPSSLQPIQISCSTFLGRKQVGLRG